MRRADHITLFHFEGCPYCSRVTSALRRLGVEVQRRDIHADPEAAAQLREATGRGTVPVLQIRESEGVRWLGESRDIVHYLYREFGDGEQPSWWMWITTQHIAIAVAIAVVVVITMLR